MEESDDVTRVAMGKEMKGQSWREVGSFRDPSGHREIVGPSATAIDWVAVCFRPTLPDQRCWGKQHGWRKRGINGRKDVDKKSPVKLYMIL